MDLSDDLKIPGTQNQNYEDNCFISIATSRREETDKKDDQKEGREDVGNTDRTHYYPNVSVQLDNERQTN